jgi:exodeoxyribonuclease-3
VKIATWNVNSVLARLPLVEQWLSTARPDVLCLQETKCTDDKFPAAPLAELGYQSVTYGQPTYNGVAILARQSITDVQRGFGDENETAHARLLAATVGGVRIVNIYVPNGQAVGTEKYQFKLDG